MRYISIFLLLFVIVFSPGCKRSGAPSAEKNLIYVSILPQKYMVERVAGKAFEVKALLPPGASPAVFEPSPAQLKELSQADAYIRIGHIGFEKAWIDKIAAANQEMKIFDQSKEVELIKTGSNQAKSDKQVVDPHIWLSPEAVNTQIRNISSFLSKLEPDSASFFTRNMQAFSGEIVRIDKKIMHLFDNTKRRTFMIYHPALGYFVRDYQLKQLPLQKEGKAPSGKYMTQLIEKNQNLGIKTIFIQRQFPAAKAKALAGELDAKIAVINPLAYKWPDNMLEMSQKIATALNE